MVINESIYIQILVFVICAVPIGLICLNIKERANEKKRREALRKGAKKND